MLQHDIEITISNFMYDQGHQREKYFVPRKLHSNISVEHLSH